MKTQRLLLIYTLMAGTLLFFDRITKFAALTCFTTQCTVNPYLSFELLMNRGISWSLLHAQNNWVFVLVSLAIVCITILLAIYSFVRWKEKKLIIGEVWILAGSLSNIIDRVMYQGVIDFIELSYNGFVWPAFNIADVCIVVGVGMMILEHYGEV